MSECCCHSSGRKFVFYIIAIALGVACGLSGVDALHQIGKYCSEIFIKIFKCISMPVISLSVIVALSTYGAEKSMNRVWKKVLKYTFGTTLIAACVSALLYILISPNNAGLSFDSNLEKSITTEYPKYILDILPDNILGAFAEHKVLTVLLISVIIGISARSIDQTNVKTTILSFFSGLHSIFFTITRFIVKILPIGLFGFVTVSVIDLKGGTSAYGMGKYFIVIILANLVQGIIILPLWLLSKKINPFAMFKSVFSALSLAFFSKSSSGALPITMEAAESKLGVKKEISRFVLPLCTTINMNGCAAFIFTTVIYIMQNYGIEISYLTIFSWIIISTIVAIGNAGIPMGCFFLSASLLSSMNIPMPILGMILPLYSIVDMFETAVNVWSDVCVTVVVDKHI